MLLAEYRGTQVAVKRVIPPRQGKCQGGRDSCHRFAAFDGITSVAGDSSTLGTKKNEHAVELSGGSSVFHQLQLHTSEVHEGFFARLPWNRAIKKRQWKRAMEFYQRAQDRHGDSRRDQWEQAFQFYRHDYDTLRNQFIAEMRHLSKLRHPCVTTVMGAVIDKGEEPMLVMGKSFAYC